MDATENVNGQRVICVLGTPRSGTSLTMRILNIAGLYVGEEHELYPPGPGNPTGFWENAGAATINHRILELLGFTNVDAPRLEPGWERSELLDPLREEARALLSESFGGHGLWGWKDPRNSVLLPFWQQLLPPMRYVICLRNPVDMAASGIRFAAERGLEIGMSTGFALWECYVTNAIANTSGHPRIFVDYEDHFGDWRRVARRLAQFAGLPALDGTSREAQVRESIDRGLRHHHSPKESVPRAGEEVPANARQIYERLRPMTAANPSLAGGVPTESAQAELDELAHVNLQAASR